MEDMSTRAMWKWVPAILVAGTVGLAYAKLPPPTEEQKAKAVEAKDKADAAAKKQTEALVKAQDRAVERYKKEKGSGTVAAKAGSGAPKK
jgi:hypothetical protein